MSEFILLECEVDPSPEVHPEDEPTVEHNGQYYLAKDLLHCLTADRINEIAYKAPRSLQEFWNALARSWPEIAAEIVVKRLPIPLAPLKTRE